MRTYALQQTRTLLRRLAFQVNHTARLGDEDSVHDLRVAIRRFSQCLRVFPQFLPKSESKKIRQKLKQVMRAAAEVRDRDVAAALLENAGVPKRAKALATLQKERKQYEQDLMQLIRHASRGNFSRKWRARLEL